MSDSFFNRSFYEFWSSLWPTSQRVKKYYEAHLFVSISHLHMHTNKPIQNWIMMLQSSDIFSTENCSLWILIQHVWLSHILSSINLIYLPDFICLFDVATETTDEHTHTHTHKFGLLMILTWNAIYRQKHVCEFRSNKPCSCLYKLNNSWNSIDGYMNCWVFIYDLLLLEFITFHHLQLNCNKTEY